MRILTFVMAIFLAACQATHQVADEGYVPVKDGKLYYKKMGNGPPVIVIHGGPGLGFAYLLPQMSELAKDHTLIFYDQRATGASLETPMDDSHIGINHAVNDLDDLRKALGYDHTYILGHSWGSLLAMKYAVSHPKNVDGMILVSSLPPTYKHMQAFFGEMHKRAADIWKQVEPLFVATPEANYTDADMLKMYKLLSARYFHIPSQVEQLTISLDKEKAARNAKVIKLIGDTTWNLPCFDITPELRKLNTKTLVIHGRQDVIPLWTAEAINQTIPNSQLAIIEDCNHYPYIEQPVQFFKLVREFINQPKGAN